MERVMQDALQKRTCAKAGEGGGKPAGAPCGTAKAGEGGGKRAGAKCSTAKAEEGGGKSSGPAKKKDGDARPVMDKCGRPVRYMQSTVYTDARGERFRVCLLYTSPSPRD
eukprot:12040320-Alexandrium_andersonii.AAC.1